MRLCVGLNGAIDGKRIRRFKADESHKKVVVYRRGRLRMEGVVVLEGRRMERERAKRYLSSFLFSSLFSLALFFFVPL